MSFQPLSNRVSIKANAQKTESEGGIILPPSVGMQDGLMSGSVLNVGPDVTAVKAGDNVLFNKYGSGFLYTKDGGFHIVLDRDILGINPPE